VHQIIVIGIILNFYIRCGNVASILELDENLAKSYKIFEAAA
jgi:serine/threonine-protein phosphatase 4 catalytic subunit